MISEIKKSTRQRSWRHVPGHLNPADLPSRGVNAKAFLESCWWQGPSWLLLSEEDWPCIEFKVDNKIVDEERRKSTKILLVEKECFLDRLRYFSNYTKIIRMISWILRMRCKNERIHSELTYEEIEVAEKCIFRLIQSAYEHKISKLHTIKDDCGILRLNTKLGLGTESFNLKFPIVLLACEPIVQRLVIERHKILQHAGTQLLITNLRESYWIIGVRKLVKKVVRECIICRRQKAKACQTPLANLPIDRTETSIPFATSGVDLAGPLLLKSGQKVWVVLFTCATYRAIHLETVELISTHDFIQALRRFIARRGKVSRIYSDNATNFRGLYNALNVLNWNEILSFSSLLKIKWIFIPPGAPWWGGFYERLIGVLKQMLRRVLGKASLTLTELQTVLCDCEAAINSRPLTYVSNNSEELKPLTPAMFIQPLVNNDVQDLDEIDHRSLNHRAKYCQKLRDDFRERFRNEYISNLIYKGKQPKVVSLSIGDIVLIQTEDKRINWPLGIIDEIYNGEDGHSRVAKIKTATGFKVRPFQRIFPLEIHHEFNSQVHDKTLSSNDISLNDNLTADAVDHDSLKRDVRDLYTTRSGRTVKVPNRFKDDF